MQDEDDIWDCADISVAVFEEDVKVIKECDQNSIRNSMKVAHCRY